MLVDIFGNFLGGLLNELVQQLKYEKKIYWPKPTLGEWVGGIILVLLLLLAAVGFLI